ncbi:MAG: hypothetical protein J6R18_04165, partial [Kiritimatiellae bacterium]|nr:hypothetical protein [Kiritimatiellia bacterium]
GVWTRGYKNGDTTVENTTLCYSGEVNGDDSQNISASDKFQLRAVPYPKAFSLNGVDVADWTVLTPGKAWQTFDPDADEFYDNISGWEQQAPQIQIPNADGSGYTIRFYVSDARDPLYETNLGPGWVGPDGCLADATIPVGIGVWFNARKTVNVPINK